MSVYEMLVEWKKNFHGGISWRLFQNAKVVDDHVNPDVFAGQKNESPFDFFQTAVVAVTDKRILIGQKRVLFGYVLNSITPDLYNDMQIYQGLVFGKIVIDTVKEKVVISNLPKSALVEIETIISSFMMEAKDHED